MKGFIAMQKMDLISDEYVREAEIDVDTPVVISEKGRFWKKFARFINSPVGVAMLCAVVSLSVLTAIVMAGTGKWGEWFPPAGTDMESGSTDTPFEETEFNVTQNKDHVAEFYQALKDKDMIGKIPNPEVPGGLMSSDDPTYIVKEEEIYNTTPTDIYEKTGAMIFDAHMMVYLWLDGEIYILNQRVVFGSGFVSAVLCDYDQNGTEDIFCSYETCLSGVWYTEFVVFDITDKALRHNLQRTPSDPSSSAIKEYMIFCEYGLIQKRIADGKEYYDVYEAEYQQEGDLFILTPTKLNATFTPSPEGLVYLPPITDIPELVPTTLSQYLDHYGFVGGLSQSEFIDGVLGKFSYEGQPLNEFPITVGDGELEDGGYVTVANFYESYLSFRHYAEHRPQGENSYSYSLTTQVPLAGFALPYNVEFGMTFAKVWEIMDLGEMKDYGMGETVLYRVGNETLTLTITEDMLPYYTHCLTFTQTATEGEGTRSVTIRFGEDTTLCEIKISVYTKGNAAFEESTPPEAETTPTLPVNRIPNTDIGEITQRLVSLGFGAPLDKSDFFDEVLDQYRFIGIPLSEYPYKGYHHDLSENKEVVGVSEYGFSYEAKSIKYQWNHLSLGGDWYIQTCSLGSKDTITGLTLPYGIRFGDTYAQVFQKMGAEGLTLTDTTIELYHDGRFSLTLKSTPEASDYTHHLIYEESFFYVNRRVIGDVTARSRDVDAKRTLTISFLPDGTVGYFNIEVQGTFSPETIELLTPPPVEEITSPEEAAQMKAKVYTMLDKLRFYADMHCAYYVPVYEDQDLYDTYFRPLGKEATPFILQYVLESAYSKFPKDGMAHPWVWEDDFWTMCYFVGAAYALIGMPEPSDGWYGYQSSDPIFAAHDYAAELYKHLHEHINTDPALWGSYTPVEDAINRMELPPLNATITKEITQAFFDTQIPESKKKQYTAEDLSIRYLGYYRTGYCVFVDGILSYTDTCETEEVCGYVFEYDSSQKLLYYKNGQFYTLTEAAELWYLYSQEFRYLYEVYTQK